ncbi:MAG: ABC transporter permease [Gammaproteobacteria bacterium]|nr:ABC transporter permease [Gammaproteobacteria bacterium]
MRWIDRIRLAAGAIIRHPLRSFMLLLAMIIGVAAVVILTSLGEGARRFVAGEFESLGTHLLIVIPGRSDTTGGGLAMMTGETPRDLTIDDAVALTRSYAVDKIAPVNVGAAAVSWGGLEREVTVIGSTAELMDIRHWRLSAGRFLPPGDPRRATSVCVIGSKIRDELFANTLSVGKWLRIGDWRCRVIGVLATEGRAIGLDVQELVVVPVASAQALFNTTSLFRILVQARSNDVIERARADILETIGARHYGEEDVTVITQDAVIATFDGIFGTLTLALGGIAAISLIVAGVLIMNVMLVSVSQRTAEIGLLKAIGASRRQVTYLFLTEATLLSVLGAALGLGLGQAAVYVIGELYPAIPVRAPQWAVIAACVTALASGLVFGIMPARRAAHLDPVDALARK